eukprot:403334388
MQKDSLKLLSIALLLLSASQVESRFGASSSGSRGGGSDPEHYYAPFIGFFVLLLILGSVIYYVKKRLQVQLRTAFCILFCCKCWSYREYEKEFNEEQEKKFYPQAEVGSTAPVVVIVDRTAEIEAKIKMMQQNQSISNGFEDTTQTNKVTIHPNDTSNKALINQGLPHNN